MTLQECYNKNDKEGFLVLAWNLCCLRKISHHDYCELKDIHDNWEEFKINKLNGKVVLGNLGIIDGKFKEL